MDAPVPAPIKVQEGPGEICNNIGCADTAELRNYFARKRSVAVRSSLLLLGIAIVVALRSPVLGLDLAIGGGSGVVNMLLIMRNNERLLDGRLSRGAYGLSTIMRVFGVGILPATAALMGPPSTLAIAYTGFFTPLVAYALALRHELRRGT